MATCPASCCCPRPTGQTSSAGMPSRTSKKRSGAKPLVKDWGAFLRFLQLAASESGRVVNYAKIANDAGLSPATVKAHYQLLEDMFIGFSVPGYSNSPRKNLTSTPRFLRFLTWGYGTRPPALLPVPMSHWPTLEQTSNNGPALNCGSASATSAADACITYAPRMAPR